MKGFEFVAGKITTNNKTMKLMGGGAVNGSAAAFLETFSCAIHKKLKCEMVDLPIYKRCNS